MHSALLVGLLNAKIKGLSLFLAISFNTSVVNAPAAADAPIKIFSLSLDEKFHNADQIKIYSPIKTDGFISFTTSNSDFMTLYFFAYQIL